MILSIDWIYCNWLVVNFVVEEDDIIRFIEDDVELKLGCLCLM